MRRFDVIHRTDQSLQEQAEGKDIWSYLTPDQEARMQNLVGWGYPLDSDFQKTLYDLAEVFHEAGILQDVSPERVVTTVGRTYGDIYSNGAA